MRNTKISLAELIELLEIAILRGDDDPNKKRRWREIRFNLLYKETEDGQTFFHGFGDDGS